MQIYRKRINIDLRMFEACYPHIQMFRVAKIIKTLSETIIMDGMDVKNIDEHDEIFKPRDKWEERLWKSCRELAKKDIRAMLKAVTSGQEYWKGENNGK